MVTSSINSAEIKFGECNKQLLEEVIFYGISLGADFVELFIENSEHLLFNLLFNMKLESYFLDILSSNKKPILCLLISYSFPGFPRPTINFSFSLMIYLL